MPTRVVFQTPLEDVESIEVEQQRFAAGREKDVIAVGYRTGRPAKAFIIVPDLELWRQKLYEMTLFEIDQAAVDKVIQELDPQSREIVDYLWANRHATIDELAKLIAAPTHMNVLLMIRGAINPTAERMIGGALLAFHQRKIDWVTGETVLFSWWVTASARAEEEAEAALPLDVFDEGDRISVVADLAGVREGDIALEVNKDRLILSVERSEERFHEEIALPAEVIPSTLTRTYTNGVLALSLEKMQAPEPRPSNRKVSPTLHTRELPHDPDICAAGEHAAQGVEAAAGAGLATPALAQEALDLIAAAGERGGQCR
ncbi:MAG: Hsp20/alpha crystallin family protein [Dehalococcoidia bacterium]|nr:Hsp20/alpha crystallin family protein [Dehalococcoidia bacterium]